MPVFHYDHLQRSSHDALCPFTIEIHPLFSSHNRLNASSDCLVRTFHCNYVSCATWRPFSFSPQRFYVACSCTIHYSFPLYLAAQSNYPTICVCFSLALLQTTHPWFFLVLHSTRWLVAPCATQWPISLFFCSPNYRPLSWFRKVLVRANWRGDNHLLILKYFMWRQGGGLSFGPTLSVVCQPPPLPSWQIRFFYSRFP